MSYRANLSQDLPATWKLKRIIFYAQGLKIYGLIPHLLNRRLKGRFISNIAMFSGWGSSSAIAAPTQEDNYTVIPYLQKPEHVQMLIDWLYEGKGFEWAIAAPENFHDNLRQWNAYKQPPSTWVPCQSEQGWREGFQKALMGDSQAIALLGGGDAMP